MIRGTQSYLVATVVACRPVWGTCRALSSPLPHNIKTHPRSRGGSPTNPRSQSAESPVRSPVRTPHNLSYAYLRALTRRLRARPRGRTLPPHHHSPPESSSEDHGGSVAAPPHSIALRLSREPRLLSRLLHTANCEKGSSQNRSPRGYSQFLSPHNQGCSQTVRSTSQFLHTHKLSPPNHIRF